MVLWEEEGGTKVSLYIWGAQKWGEPCIVVQSRQWVE